MAQVVLRKISLTVVGFLVVFVGVLLLVLPGPGLLVIAAGLAILSVEYHWARRLLAPLKERLRRLKRSKDNHEETK